MPGDHGSGEPTDKGTNVSLIGRLLQAVGVNPTHGDHLRQADKGRERELV